MATTGLHEPVEPVQSPLRRRLQRQRSCELHQQLAEQRIESEAVTDKNPSKTRILLVEDDVELAESTREYLERYEFTVDIETRGDRARGESSARRPIWSSST